MPMDIPPDKPTPPPARVPSDIETAKVQARSTPAETVTVKALVTEVVKATQGKAEAQAQSTNLQTQKSAYEALLTINPGSKHGAPKQAPVTQIDNTVSQQIVQGKPVQVRVTTNAPLQVGQQLKVQLQGQALKLMQVAPPDLKASLQQFIRHEVNQQNSYTYLLSKLMGIAQAIKTQNALLKTPANAKTANPMPTPSGSPAQATSSKSALPQANASKTGSANIPSTAPQLKNNVPVATPTSVGTEKPQIAGPSTQLIKQIKPLENAVERFIQSLPTKSGVASAEGLKTAIKNSGVFYESQITKPVAQPNQNKAPTISDNSLGAAKIAKKAPEMIQQIRQQIKELRSALNEQSVPASSGKKSISSELTQSLKNDLKFNLLNLQKQLESLQKNQGPNVKVGNEIPQAGKNVIADKVALKDQPVEVKADATKTGDVQRAENRAAAARATSPVYQRPTNSPQQTTGAYAITDAESKSSGTKKPTGPELLIAPPLPGKVSIQAQAIRPQTMAKDSLADALISVLIKNTKEATSRLNLHQLSNMPEMNRQDGAAPPTVLSFELPILNGTELSLFQFRIQEEENENSDAADDPALQKKWVVHMGFDIEGLGAMYCQVTLIGVSASVTFWAEEKDTVDRSQAYLDELRGNLSNLGVTVKDIQCIEGSPPQDQSGIQQTLIDIET